MKDRWLRERATLTTSSYMRVGKIEASARRVHLAEEHFLVTGGGRYVQSNPNKK